MQPPVQTSWVEVAGSAGTFSAYLALPPAGHGPGLLLLQEIFGVNTHIQAVAQQYALAGFVVMAPDLFWQQRPRVQLGYVGEDREQALTLMRGADRAALARDLRDSVAALQARPEVAGGKVGALGYCMGGRLAYVAAATTPIHAAVAYYGGGIQDQLDLAEHIACPVMFHYGRKDAGIPPEAVKAVGAAMAKKVAHLYTYDADHGFNCWERAMYEPRSAALALGRSVQFLASELF